MKVKSLFTCLAAILLTVVTAASCDNYLGIDDDLDDASLVASVVSEAREGARQVELALDDDDEEDL